MVFEFGYIVCEAGLSDPFAGNEKAAIADLLLHHVRPSGYCRFVEMGAY